MSVVRLLSAAAAVIAQKSFSVKLSDLCIGFRSFSSVSTLFEECYLRGTGNRWILSGKESELPQKILSFSFDY